MRRRPSTCSDPRPLAATIALALALPALVVATETKAFAQACCIAPGAAGAARLAPYETVLVGVDVRAQSPLGTFDPAGRFRSTPSGSRELTLEQSVFGTVRVLSHGQLTLTVPFVETLRSSGGSSAAGGGLGDVRLAARWDLVDADDARPAPGLAVIGGVVAPTGAPPERASDALGAGATGTGAVQGWGGVSLEQAWGPWLALATATVTMRTEREIGATRLSLPPRWSTGLLGAHAWTSGVALAAGASYAIEGRASVDGVAVAGSARRVLTTTVALQVPAGPLGRVVGSVFATPPIPGASAGEAAPLGVSLALIRPWS